MDHLIANDPITAELQAIAGKAFKDADKAEGLKRGSRTSLVYCLIAAAAAPVEAILKTAKGETVFSHAFTVAQFCDADHVATATGGDSNAKGAMVKAVMERYGVTDPSSAQKQALSQAAPIAFHLAQAVGGFEAAVVEDENGIAPVHVTKRGNLSVPGFVMLREPKEDAPESALQAYNRDSKLPFVIDGSKGHSFNELSSRVRPKVEREGSSGQGADKGKAMSRIDAATVLLRGAAGGDDWVAYLADLTSAEVCAMVRAWGENDADANA